MAAKHTIGILVAEPTLELCSDVFHSWAFKDSENVASVLGRMGRKDRTGLLWPTEVGQEEDKGKEDSER